MKIQRTHKAPGWIRGLQIGIGAAAIGLAIAAIFYPGLAVTTIILIISVILLIFGIEQVGLGAAAAAVCWRRCEQSPQPCKVSSPDRKMIIIENC
jgi:hypothetical protein